MQTTPKYEGIYQSKSTVNYKFNFVSIDLIIDIQFKFDVLKDWKPGFFRQQHPKGCNDGVHS